MTIPRGYVANHKIWDRMGRVTPNVEYSPGERPHFESFAAPWLPTLRYEYEIESYITISSGQVTSLDTNGHLVPAGLRKAFNVAYRGGMVMGFCLVSLALFVLLAIIWVYQSK